MVLLLFLLVRLWVIRAVIGLDTLDTSEVEEISRFPLLWFATARCCSESLPCGHSLARIGLLCNLCCCISLVSAHLQHFPDRICALDVCSLCHLLHFFGVGFLLAFPPGFLSVESVFRFWIGCLENKKTCERR